MSGWLHVALILFLLVKLFLWWDEDFYIQVIKGFFQFCWHSYVAEIFCESMCRQSGFCMNFSGSWGAWLGCDLWNARAQLLITCERERGLFVRTFMLSHSDHTISHMLTVFVFLGTVMRIAGLQLTGCWLRLQCTHWWASFVAPVWAAWQTCWKIRWSSTTKTFPTSPRVQVSLCGYMNTVCV